MNILDLKILDGGGVIAGPQYVGIFVNDDPAKCPAGWIFVDVNNPPENTQEILDSLSKGRTYWPEPAASIKVPKKTNKKR